MNTKISLSTFNKFAAAVAGSMLLAMAAPVFAQSGQFTYVIGTVTVERSGQTITPIRGTTVTPLDVKIGRAHV